MLYLVANKITGEIVAENVTSTVAARIMGIKHYSSAAQSAKVKNFPPGKYYVRRMGEYVEHEEITHNNPILVTDITTGEMRVFSGVKDVSKALYCNQSNVSRRAKDGRLLFKKYRLRRLNYVGEAKEIGAI